MPRMTAFEKRPAPDEPNKSIGFIINDVARLLRRNFDRRAHVLGLTRAQWTVLAHLRRKDGLRQTELADLLEVQPITLARLIDRMEADSWVKRKNDPTDRRAKQVFLTKKVLPVLKGMRAIGKTVMDESLAGIADNEQEQLRVMLLAMRDNLSARK